MTGYEVVKRAIEFKGPERLPMRFSALGIDDTHEVCPNQIGPGDCTKEHYGGFQTYDEWGCLWVRSEVANMGQVKGHPLEKWESLKEYQWPDPNDVAFYQGMEQKFNGSEGKYVLTGIFMLLFERMHFLHGMENVLRDLYLNRENLEMLAERILEYDIAVIHNIAERFPGRIHGFNFSDDWGHREGYLYQPPDVAEFL